MEDFLVRLALYTALPVALGAGVIGLDKSATGTSRRLEALLVPMFIIGVAGGGLSSFVAHFFLADRIAASIGWAPGSPFQLEIAFTNLAIGVLGAVAAGRRDGFREATAIALFIFGAGASIVHFMDMGARGNFAAGNLIPGLFNVVKPAILIVLLVLLRRAESRGDTAPEAAGAWGRALVNASVAALVIGATAFATGYATDRVLVFSLPGMAAGAGAFAWMVLRASSHREGAAKGPQGGGAASGQGGRRGAGWR